MKSIRIAMALVLALGGAVAVEAQAAAGKPQTRERLRRNINNLRLLRMTEVLELNEEQTARIYPFFSRIEREKAELQMSLAADLRDLRQALRRPPFDEVLILETIEAINRTREEIRNKDLEFEALLGKVLSPVQKGRYLVFMVDFYRGLGENLERLREAPAKIKRGS